MIIAHVDLPERTIALDGDIQIGWDIHGDNELSVENSNVARSLFNRAAQYTITAYDAKGRVWSGRIAELELDNGQYHVRAKGDIYQLDQIEDYIAWYSIIGSERFTQVTSGMMYPPFPITVQDALFDYSTDNESVYFTLAKDAALSNQRGAAMYIRLPLGKVVSAYAMNLECRIPTGFTLTYRQADSAGTISTISTVAGNGAVQSTVFSGIDVEGTDCVVAYLALRNETGGTYTNTQENGHWYVRASDVRYLSTSSDIVRTTLNGAVSAGNDVTITPVSMVGIYVGAKVVFPTGSNPQVITVKTVGSTTFTADIRGAQANGATMHILRLLHSTIVRDVISGMFVNPSIQATTTDVVDSVYHTKDAFSLVQEIAKKEQYDLYSRAGAFFFRPISERVLHYAMSDTYRVAIDLYNSVYKSRGMYDRFGEKALTPYATQQYNSALLTRSQTTDIATQASGIAYINAAAMLTQQLVSKTEVSVRKLRNQYHGEIDINAVQIPANVRITNIDPTLSHVKTDFTLREIRIDADGETDYILDELPDTIETLLAR